MMRLMITNSASSSQTPGRVQKKRPSTEVSHQGANASSSHASPRPTAKPPSGSDGNNEYINGKATQPSRMKPNVQMMSAKTTSSSVCGRVASSVVGAGSGARVSSLSMTSSLVTA